MLEPLEITSSMISLTRLLLASVGLEGKLEVKNPMATRRNDA